MRKFGDRRREQPPHRTEGGAAFDGGRVEKLEREPHHICEHQNGSGQVYGDARSRDDGSKKDVNGQLGVEEETGRVGEPFEVGLAGYPPLFRPPSLDEEARRVLAPADRRLE